MPTYAQLPTNYRQLAQRFNAAGPTSAMYAATAIVGAGAVDTANPATSGRMPAVGIYLESVVSGLQVKVLTGGQVSHAAYSGVFTSGSPVFAASGGFPTPTPPAVSGNIVQRLGMADTATSFQVSPDVTYFQIGQ